MTTFALSPQAQRAADEATQKDRFYSEPCPYCGDQRRQHGKHRCFAPGCNCKNGQYWQPVPPTTVNHIRKVKAKKNTVYVGRPPKAGDQAHHFGNPFKISDSMTRAQAIQAFSDWLAGTAHQEVEPERRAWILAHLRDLRGKVLLCWCKPEACHGDILAKLADQ